MAQKDNTFAHLDKNTEILSSKSFKTERYFYTKVRENKSFFYIVHSKKQIHNLSKNYIHTFIRNTVLFEKMTSKLPCMAIFVQALLLGDKTE